MKCVKCLTEDGCMLIRLFFILLFATSVRAQDSFENTMKKIEMLEGNNTKVEYDKIQPIKDQYCFMPIVDNDGNKVIGLYSNVKSPTFSEY